MAVVQSVVFTVYAGKQLGDFAGDIPTINDNNIDADSIGDPFETGTTPEIQDSFGSDFQAIDVNLNIGGAHLEIRVHSLK